MIIKGIHKSDSLNSPNFKRFHCYFKRYQDINVNYGDNSILQLLFPNAH